MSQAFLKAGFQRTFYDLGRVNYWGPQSKKGVDFKFDRTRTNHRAETGDWKAAAETSRKAAKREAVVHEAAGVIKACGGGTEQLSDEEADEFNAVPARSDAPGRSGAHI